MLASIEASEGKRDASECEREQASASEGEREQASASEGKRDASGKTSENVLPDSASECQCNRRVMST